MLNPRTLYWLKKERTYIIEITPSFIFSFLFLPGRWEYYTPVLSEQRCCFPLGRSTRAVVNAVQLIAAAVSEEVPISSSEHSSITWIAFTFKEAPGFAAIFVSKKQTFSLYFSEIWRLFVPTAWFGVLVPFICSCISNKPYQRILDQCPAEKSWWPMSSLTKNICYHVLELYPSPMPMKYFPESD